MSGAEAFETVFAFDNERYVKQLHFTVTANLICPRELFFQGWAVPHRSIRG